MSLRSIEHRSRAGSPTGFRFRPAARKILHYFPGIGSIERNLRMGGDMDVPEHLWRHPTTAGLERVAVRFGFVTNPSMQDPEAEWADCERIDEFLAVYESGELDDDERFVLMAVVLNSLRCSPNRRKTAKALPCW